MPLFDRYIVVDWSAESRPKTGKDSIWICQHDLDDGNEIVVNPPTRRAAQAHLAELVAGAVETGKRMLVSFDFPFGYPAGFAARLGLSGDPWRVVWDEIAKLIEDNPANQSNRFKVGAEFNRRISGSTFPFWGCPAGSADEFLQSRRLDRYVVEGLAEKRVIDQYMRGAQPCWKLAYPGSVGSQALTGIPVVRELRYDPRWRDQARIWPFETGLSLLAGPRIVFAEVWPSWWKARPDLGPPNDKAQVRTVAAIFAEQDRSGGLETLFAGDPNLPADQRHIIEGEEAWALGVIAPRHSARRKLAVSSSSYRRKPVSRSAMGPDLRREDNPVQVHNRRYAYLRDPAEIYRRSFALIRAEAPFDRLSPDIEPLALRLAHAAGDAAILADLAWSPGAVERGRKALAAGAPILVDAAMVAAGIAKERLPAGNPVVCTLRDAETPLLAARLQTTRSSAAVELWRPHLAGALVAIGNAPTALFRLLELIIAGAGKPALVLGFPVGFVGAAEAKSALAQFGDGLAYVTLHGRRGGSALAAAAVNALCGPG